MKRFIALFLLLGCSWLAQAKDIEVVLIGGQSNATGQGYMRNIPSSFVCDTSVLFYHSRYLNNGQGGESWGPLRQASETKDKFGVELSLGTSLQKQFPECQFALIKHALSGSNLYKQWNPGNRRNEEQGQEYAKFVKTVSTAISELKKQGYRPRIRAMVWQQGEGDARDIAGMENSIQYGANLKNLIEQIRKEFDAEDMLFVYGTVIPLPAVRFPGRDAVKKAQLDVAQSSQTSLSVKGAILVQADDLQMRSSDYKTPMPNDDVHLGTYGLLNLGERFANAIYEATGK